ncbi:MAG: calcium-binding protein [Alphaproteobacteria bacterium]|mgnify:CR=1 FL=1|nr:calcium-binding protein [Alphaproteobacteria bacterium]
MGRFILGPDNDTQDGTRNDDLMRGLGGDDVLSGLAGNDDIYGGIGNDILKGMIGDDLLVGGSGKDRLIGGDGNDVLYGGSGRDILVGGDGVDFLNGNGGNATLTGGAGVDNFQVDVGARRVVITDFKDNVDVLLLDSNFYPGKTVQQIITLHGSSSGGDSAIDLSGNGADAPRIILLGFDNIFNIVDDIVLI